MKMRKTVEVSVIRERINGMLANDKTTPEERKGLAFFLETVLHETGNYAGFNYLDWVTGGFERWEADGRPSDTTPYLGDQTKRVYYAKNNAPTTPKSGATVSADFPRALAF